MSLIENLSNDKHLSQLSEIIYDENNRYVKLNRRIKFSNQIQQSTITDEKFNSIANEFKLSSLFIKKQYELALKNRIEIPPTLMRQILIDAIEILYLIINQCNENDEKFSRISQHISKLKRYNELFNEYC